MTLPGNTIDRDDSESQVGPNLNLAVAFVACETQRAPDGVHFIRSMRGHKAVCGERTLDTAAGFDFLDGHFHEGGAGVYLTPLRGVAAAKASVVLADASSQTAATLTWNVPGTDGNKASVDIDAAGAGTFIAKLFYENTLILTSPVLADQVALQAWAASALGGGRVTVVPGAGGDPAATSSPVAFMGGDDDFDGIGVAQIAAALARFTPNLGPGSFVLPGRTAVASHLKVADALVAARINRVAHLVMPDVDAATIAAQAAQIRAHAAADMIDLLAGRQSIPGLTTTSGPGSIGLDALRTGRQGANDAAGVTPNQPAAGTPYGAASWATGLTHQGKTVPWTDAELELLYDAGVNVALEVDGEIRLYGSRTAADPELHPAGFRLGSARLRMALSELLRYRVESIQFHELDPAGVRINELKAQIAADVDLYPTSIHTYRVVAGVVAGPTPGTAVLDAGIEDLQVSYDAEVIGAHVSRTVTRIATGTEG